MRSELSVLILCALASPALADDTSATVTVGTQEHLRLGKNITKVAVADSQIAQVSAFDPDQLVVAGLRPGTTSATVYAGGEVHVISITVGWPLDAMRAALRKALPDAQDLDV